MWLHQIEGAWNEDGKGPSIWDVFTKVPHKHPSLSQPRFRVMSSMGPVETLLVTVTTTTKRMSASWRKWEWLATGPSSPLRSYPFVFSFNWHTEGGILSYHSPLPRFSIAWSRILPAGVGTRNPAGINYYHNLIGAKYYIHNQAHAKLRWMLSKDIHKYDQNNLIAIAYS